MPPPKVSFIIPYYNNGDTLAETIDSIRAQTYQDYDIWIIDDGSTDAASLEVLTRYEGQPGITVLHQANAGPSVARNLAIRQTGAEIIVPLDADDKIKPGSLELAIRTFAQHPDIDVIYSDQDLFGDEQKRRVTGEIIFWKLLITNSVALCTFIRKRLFDEIGYFDEQISKLGLEDWELWIRALSQGKKFFYIPQSLFDIRVRQSSRTFTQANKNIDSLKQYIYTKHLTTLTTEYERLYRHSKWLESTPPVRLMFLLARPYRAVKRLLGK